MICSLFSLPRLKIFLEFVFLLSFFYDTLFFKYSLKFIARCSQCKPLSARWKRIQKLVKNVRCEIPYVKTITQNPTRVSFCGSARQLTWTERVEGENFAARPTNGVNRTKPETREWRAPDNKQRGQNLHSPRRVTELHISCCVVLFVVESPSKTTSLNNSLTFSINIQRNTLVYSGDSVRIIEQRGTTELFRTGGNCIQTNEIIPVKRDYAVPGQ